MFDKSDRISMYGNIFVVFFGIFVVLCSDYVATGLLITISALLLLYVLRWLNKTVFTISCLDRILTIQDDNGVKAVEVQKQTITVNRSGQTEFWCNNIQSEGAVSYIDINGQSPAEQKQEGEQTSALIKFDAPLKTGAALDLVLSYSHNNAFKKAQQTLVHIIDNETKQLHLVVELPKGRSVDSARLFRKYNGQDEQLLPPIIIGKSKIEAEVNNPPLGAIYYLQWDSHKENMITKMDDYFFNS